MLKSSPQRISLYNLSRCHYRIQIIHWNTKMSNYNCDEDLDHAYDISLQYNRPHVNWVSEVPHLKYQQLCNPWWLIECWRARSTRRIRDRSRNRCHNRYIININLLGCTHWSFSPLILLLSGVINLNEPDVSGGKGNKLDVNSRIQGDSSMPT